MTVPRKNFKTVAQALLEGAGPHISRMEGNEAEVIKLRGVQYVLAQTLDVCTVIGDFQLEQFAAHYADTMKVVRRRIQAGV